MAFELDFDIKVSPDKRYLWIEDKSKYHESLDSRVYKQEIKLRTYLSVMGEMVSAYKVVPFTFAQGESFDEGCVLQVAAYDINPDSSPLILDNVYDVVLKLYGNENNVFVSSQETIQDFYDNEYMGNIIDQPIIKIINSDASEHYYINVFDTLEYSAVVEDFVETLEPTSEVIEKNNIEGVYPITRWYLDQQANGHSVSTITQKEADKVVFNEALYKMLMINTEYGDTSEISEILSYFAPYISGHGLPT